MPCDMPPPAPSASTNNSPKKYVFSDEKPRETGKVKPVEK